MARSIDHSSTFDSSADTVFATMTDPEYLRARLRELGGPGSALLEHEATAERARYRLRQGLAEKDLPPIVGKVVSGDLAIERTETLERADGGYTGKVAVQIKGAPATASGSMRLAPADAGSVFEVHTDVSVSVPLIGGKIEEIVADQVRKLLAAETEFTASWLRSH